MADEQPIMAAAEYETYWRNKFLTTHAVTIDEMIAGLEGAAEQLRQMKEAGVTLDDNGGQGDDYARLVTSDPGTAQRFGMSAVSEDEFEDDEDYPDEDEDDADDDDEFEE